MYTFASVQIFVSLLARITYCVTIAFVIISDMYDPGLRFIVENYEISAHLINLLLVEFVSLLISHLLSGNCCQTYCSDLPLRLKCCYAAYLIQSFRFYFFNVSPIHTTAHFLQFIFYIPIFVLLLLLSRWMRTISCIVLEVILMNYRIMLGQLFSIVSVMELMGGLRAYFCYGCLD